VVQSFAGQVIALCSKPHSSRSAVRANSLQGVGVRIKYFVAYYIRSRTHLALGKDTPSPRPVTPPSAGRIVAIPEVSGLHHRFDRIAA
jgi:hypothetical protein